MPKRLTKKDIDAILLTIGVDFQPIDKCVFFEVTPAYSYWNSEVEFVEAVIKHGLNDYLFRSFYEVMIWYRYYICKRHRIKKYILTKDGNRYYANASYFARIPRRYRTMTQKQGLNIVREAMDHFILHYNGLPPDFTLDRLNDCYCKIENDDNDDDGSKIEDEVDSKKKSTYNHPVIYSCI